LPICQGRVLTLAVEDRQRGTVLIDVQQTQIGHFVMGCPGMETDIGSDDSKLQTNSHNRVCFILRPCQYENSHIDGQSQIKVHTDERTQVHNAQSVNLCPFARVHLHL